MDSSTLYALSVRNMLTAQLLLVIITTFATVFYGHLNPPLIHFCFFTVWMFLLVQAVGVMKVHGLLGIPI
jgi:ABC-type multidrug transport system permease subunit